MAEEVISAVVTGAQEVIDAFRELETELPRNTVPRALQKSARYMKTQIQAAAPIGGTRSRDPHPGQLIANITTRSRRLRASVVVRAPAFYWRFLEKGWTSRAGRFFMYPFAEPVIQHNFNTVLRIIIDDVGRKIESLRRGG